MSVDRPVLSRWSVPRSVRAIFVLAALLTVGLATGPPPARAMFDGPAYAFPVPDYVSGLVGASTLNRAIPSSGGSGNPSGSKPKPPKRPKPVTAAQRRKLRFTTSPAVSEALHQMIATRSDTDLTLLDPEIHRVQASWNAVLKAVRWSRRDLGDSAAFTLVQLYRMYYGRTTFPPAGLQSVRRVVRDDLARQASVRRMSTVRKQQTAETLQLRTMLLDSTLDLAKRNHDARSKRSARSDVRAFAREIYGLDLRRIRVSSKGLVRR